MKRCIPTPSKVDFVDGAKSLGYQAFKVMIYLKGPVLNQARISERVNEGAHDDPAGKVLSHISRLLHYFRASLPLSGVAGICGNSSADHPFTPVFTVTLRIGKSYGSMP